MDTQRWVSLINVAALVTIMFSMGLQVTIAAVAASARSAGRVTLGLIANYLLVPVLTLGLMELFEPAPMIAAGFLILAVCPGAPVGPPAATRARGNVPWAIGYMVILAGLSAILSPTMLGVLLPRYAPDSSLVVDYLAICRTLVVAQLLPLAVGLTVHHFAPTLTGRIARPVGLLANAMLIVLIGLILVTQFDTLAAIRARGWAGMSVLFVGSLAIGWLCGSGDVPTRNTSALTTAARNAAVGLAIATGNFAGKPVVTAVVAFGLVSMLGTLGCAALIGSLSGRSAVPLGQDTGVSKGNRLGAAHE
jgi:bile acid:Na+ symporter, BASS family